MQGKPKKKKNHFKIHCIFNKNGESINAIIERSFKNYYLKNTMNKS